ncbi:MAG: hypothetical protein IJG23_05110 [Clostridia bacterium]|nr:hypothetical protein [Clostridia bacterium]
MRFEERFTDRICFPEQGIDENGSYVMRIKDTTGEFLIRRLGLYEDLGFSPAELAEILLKLDWLDADQIERIIIAKKRIDAFDSHSYYFNEYKG